MSHGVGAPLTAMTKPPRAATAALASCATIAAASRATEPASANIRTFITASPAVGAVYDRPLEIGHFFGGCEQWCPHWRLQFLHFVARVVMHTKRDSEFPSRIRRGGCAINKCGEASLAGADGVVDQMLRSHLIDAGEALLFY